MTLYGIDISSHQGHTPSLVGKAFVFVRATYGAHGDSMYQVHAGNVRKAGKVLGAYHFSRPVSTGDTVAEQVHDFLLVAKDADLLAFDWEEDVFIDANGVRKSNGRMLITDARKFIAAVQATGRRIGLYASAALFRDIGQDFDWVAKWSATPPSRHYDIWQYDGGGADHIDNDLFRGTIAQLRELGTGPLPESSTEATVIVEKNVYDSPRTATSNGKPVTGYLLDGTSHTEPSWSGLVSAEGIITRDDGLAPKGGGWVVGASRPFTGYYLPAASLTVSAAPPATDCSAEVATATADLAHRVELLTADLAGERDKLAAAQAGEAERTAAAIAADRAKARVIVSWE